MNSMFLIDTAEGSGEAPPGTPEFDEYLAAYGALSQEAQE